MSRSAAHTALTCLRRFADAGRRAVAWVLLAALMLQVAAFAIGPALAVPAGSPDRIEVCTVVGMVVLDSQGQPVPQSADSHGQFCALCLPLLHSGGSLAVEGCVPLPLPVAFALPQPPPPAGDTSAAPLPLAGAASPQAPPFL
ncbi:MAG: hypothetical protein ACM31D_19655 [Bacteroidota bacterium]